MTNMQTGKHRRLFTLLIFVELLTITDSLFKLSFVLLIFVELLTITDSLFKLSFHNLHQT
jgi:hypothetical protein